MFVLLLAIPTLCIRLNDLPLFGEEPRRALIAREMLETGDWLVPGTQRVFQPSRPPLQNWLIAVAAFLRGSFDPWIVRLPSVLATVVISVIVYGYLRQQIGTLGSVTGAVSFLTMLLVMEFGRSAETEAVFTAFVAGSMFLWHWGWIKKWPAWQMWSIGYACAALGMLTKGLQAPVYFVGSTTLFLLATGNWRAIVTHGHVIGILTFAAVFGTWQGPFTFQRGISDSWAIYFGDVAARFVDQSWWGFLSHLIVFPSELLCVRLMPWTVLLLAYSNRQIRGWLAPHRKSVLFLSICILFSFVFVWIPPGSKVRYYMPLFPSFAALIGIAADGLAWERKEIGLSRLWNRFVENMAYLMAGAAAVVLGASLAFPALKISLPAFGAWTFATASLGLAWVAWSTLKKTTDRAMIQGVSAVAVFSALVQISLITSVQQRRCEDIEGHVTEVKKQIPDQSQLVSLGPVHHAFAFFYGQPIPIVSIEARLPEGIEYFCVHTYNAEPPMLPFEWTELAMVSCDRLNEWSIPKDRVYVGRVVAIQGLGMKFK